MPWQSVRLQIQVFAFSPPSHSCLPFLQLSVLRFSFSLRGCLRRVLVSFHHFVLWDQYFAESLEVGLPWAL